MGGVNIMFFGALVTTALSLVIVIVAMATTHWAEIPGTNVGLWKNCFTGPRGTCVTRGSNVPDTFKTAQAGIVMAFIANLIAILTLALFGFLSKLKRVTQISTIVFLSLAVLFNILAVVMFALEYNTGLAWSWGMAIFAAILEIIAIILTGLASRSEYRRANTS